MELHARFDGCVSYIKLFYQTSDTAYYRYVKTFADQFISASGEIKTYHPDEYNIDKLNGGNFLFDMFTITQDPKYVSAIRLLFSFIPIRGWGACFLA